MSMLKVRVIGTPKQIDEFREFFNDIPSYSLGRLSFTQWFHSEENVRLPEVSEVFTIENQDV